MFNRIYSHKESNTTLIVDPEGTTCIPLFYKTPDELSARHWDKRAFHNFFGMKLDSPLNDDSLPFTSFADGIDQGYMEEMPCPLM